MTSEILMGVMWAGLVAAWLVACWADRGHQWQAVLASVRYLGTWCPQCKHMSIITNRKSKARAKYEVAG